jgi:hypothetical protein
MLERTAGLEHALDAGSLGDDDLAGRRASEKVAARGVVDGRPSPHGPRAGVDGTDHGRRLIPQGT